MKLIAGKNIRLDSWGDQTRISAQFPPAPRITAGRHLGMERTAQGCRISCLEDCSGAAGRSEIRIVPAQPVYYGWPVSLIGPVAPVTDAAAMVQWNRNEPEIQAAPLTGQQRTGLFAVALEDIAAGDVGRALLAGTVMLPINVSNRLHEFVEAVGSGYATAGAGYHRLVWRSVESGNGFGIVLLNSGITPARYFGAFCVEVNSAGQLRIFNSSRPDDAIAGTFYWGINQAPVTVLAQTLNCEDGIVYLRASGNGATRTVTIDFFVRPAAAVVDDVAVSHIPLARVDGHTVEQLYRAGDVRMHWRM